MLIAGAPQCNLLLQSHDGPDKVRVMESSARFRSGDVAPRSGVYRVHHYAHRLPHAVIIIGGTVLPKCKRCGDKVRFVPIVAGEPVESDVDFVMADRGAA